MNKAQRAGKPLTSRTVQFDELIHNESCLISLRHKGFRDITEESNRGRGKIICCKSGYWWHWIREK